MKALLIGLSLIAMGFAADDAWTKVKEIQSGADVRILKAGVKDLLTANFSEADDQRVIVVIKNTQMAIAKADILKLEARPVGSKRLTKEEKMQKLDPAAEQAKPKVPVPGSKPVPDMQSSSTSVSFGSKPGFELVYHKGMK